MTSLTPDTQRPLFRNFSWRFFAITEGLFRVAQVWLLLLVGVTASFGPMAFLVMAVIGLIQLVSGIIINRRSRYEVFPGKGYVIGSLLAGVFVFYLLATSILIFAEQTAELSFVVFALALFLIFETIVDKRKLRGISYILFSLALLIFSVFAFLGFPTESFPTWALLALTLPLVILLSEYVVRRFRVNIISPWVRNVWMGGAVFVLSIMALIAFHPVDQLLYIAENTNDFYWVLSILLGTVVLSSVFLHQRTYMYGGSVAVKKCVTTGIFVVFGLALSIIVFAEGVTVGKLIGLAAYVGAYLAVEPSVVRSMSRKEREEAKQRIV